jgi:inner membrane protein
MEPNQFPAATGRTSALKDISGRYTVKGLITGFLILAMMIPALFIQELVREREQRQREVSGEVSQKWSSAQILSGPYIFLPYRAFETTEDGKTRSVQRHYWILPEQLDVQGTVDHEIRKRSIYQVLLYRAALSVKGQFLFRLPKELDSAAIRWEDARICVGISDFKGIEERIVVRFNGNDYELSPGLPATDIDAKGLSAPLSLRPADLGKPWDLGTMLRIKGSGQLHFKPMSGNSVYQLSSSWPSPSFDGNSLPSEKAVTDSGFTARWTFNKANLPFNTVLRDFSIDNEAIAFGVTLLQPADHYTKTTRSVKYALLFIGLTFALCFILEILQKRPLHPVQYVLVGMALVIFYTLLLSISEFLEFDLAYLIAASATVLLVSLYAWSHFRKSSTAWLFGAVLGGLYGFIFVLIRLEDTALLVGSIALFLVLAVVMYASRKVRWYGGDTPLVQAQTTQGD